VSAFDLQVKDRKIAPLIIKSVNKGSLIFAKLHKFQFLLGNFEEGEGSGF